MNKRHWRLGLLATVAVTLLLFAACSQTNEASDSKEIKKSYSLCLKTSDARQRLYEHIRDFADQEGAQIIDRGAGAQRELSAMGSTVLKNTGGETILLTVEKTNEFRISVTNLGLKEKIALTVRSLGETEDNAVAEFMSELTQFWKVDRVEGSVTNDPPC